MLSADTGKTLPWGTLTGIRPTKIPLQFLEEGKNDEDIRRYMEDTYYCSDGKIDLSIAISEVLKSSTIILLLSISPFVSVDACFAYLNIPILFVLNW